MAPVSATAPPANPFSTRFVRPDRTDYRFAAGQDADAVAGAAIAQLNHCGTAAIIGPHGTGKSTLLHTLMPRLQAAFAHVQLVRLSSTSQAVQELRRSLEEQATAGDECAVQPRCLVIDGFEQLPWLVRQRLIGRSRRWAAKRRRGRRAAAGTGLLVTAHRAQLRVPTLFWTGWDDELVSDLTAEKLCDLPEPTRQTMLRLAAEHAARLQHSRPAARNVRDYWFTLYDEYERLRAHHSSAAAPRRENAR